MNLKNIGPDGLVKKSQTNIVNYGYVQIIASLVLVTVKCVQQT